jgi:hypothetical protein
MTWTIYRRTGIKTATCRKPYSTNTRSCAPAARTGLSAAVLTIAGPNGAQRISVSRHAEQEASVRPGKR